MPNMPPFLDKVRVPQKERKFITSNNSNWNKLYNTLLHGDRDPEEILKLIKVELERSEPRAGMLGRLVGKYTYNQRRQMMIEINQTLEEMKSEKGS